MKNYKFILVVFFLLVLGVVNPVIASQQAAFLKELEVFRATATKGVPIIQGHHIYAHELAVRMIQLNGQQPLWDKQDAKVLQKNLQNLETEGLQPQDYLFQGVGLLLQKRQQAGSLSNREILELEILLTESFARALYNLKFGKVDPVRLDKGINFTEKLPSGDFAPVLLKYIVTDTIDSSFDYFMPNHPIYKGLKSELKRYRNIQTAGGWPSVAGGGVLKLGDTDTRVVQLKSRLLDEGFRIDDPESTHFNEELHEQVKLFQKQYSLAADGVVGSQTVEELNIPVERRIDQIRVGLERGRWYVHEAKGEFVIVDIAGFELYWMRNEQLIWKGTVQVGKKHTKTPVFKNAIRYIQINPTWTIPPGIIKRTIWPGLRHNPYYLEEKGYDLLDQQGKPVDPQSIDWANQKTFPFMVRQPPGPNNALGRIKFMFPNPYYVYLHDTNHKEFFSKSSRAFSAGCIRLDNPFDFAEILLGEQNGWTREKIDQAVASGKTQTVNLKKPLPIVIAYLTTTYRDGNVVFKQDVYNRDQAVLKALNGSFKLRKQDM